MITLGKTRYDEVNGRWITPESTGVDPQVYDCKVEELDDNDGIVTYRQLFTRSELQKIKEVGLYV